MNYGLYLSASGVLTALYRQDVFANNLANVHTVGFKTDRPSVRQRDPEAVEGGFSEFRKHLLDKMGGGVLAGPQRVSLQRGAFQTTGNPLDLALQGENAFLAVQTMDPRTGAIRVQLTRDGRLSLNAAGQLVTAAGGHAVLDVQDRPITLQPNIPVHINAQGQISQAGQVVAQLQVTGAAQRETLVKQGQNLLWFADGRDQRSTPDDAGIVPEHVEASTVDPIRALMDLVSATKAVSSNGNLIQYHDQMMDRAINTLGRVA